MVCWMPMSMETRHLPHDIQCTNSAETSNATELFVLIRIRMDFPLAVTLKYIPNNKNNTIYTIPVEFEFSLSKFVQLVLLRYLHLAKWILNSNSVRLNSTALKKIA